MTGRAVKVLLYNGQATSPVTAAVRDLADEEPHPGRAGDRDHPEQGRALPGLAARARCSACSARSAADAMAIVELHDATVSYGDRCVLEALDLEIAAGRVPRGARPQRRGQDHDAQSAPRPVAAVGRHRHRRRPAPGKGAAARSATSRSSMRSTATSRFAGRDLVRFGVDGHRPGLPFSNRQTRELVARRDRRGRRRRLRRRDRSASCRAANSSDCASPRRSSPIRAAAVRRAAAVARPRAPAGA